MKENIIQIIKENFDEVEEQVRDFSDGVDLDDMTEDWTKEGTCFPELWKEEDSERKYLLDLIESTINNLLDVFEIQNDKIMGYKVVADYSSINLLVGHVWSWSSQNPIYVELDENSENVLGAHVGDIKLKEVIISSGFNVEDVDWVKTIALNSSKRFSREEKPLIIKKGTPISIVGAKNTLSNWQNLISKSPFSDKNLHT